MLLIQHDQAQLRKRQKNGRASAHDQHRFRAKATPPSGHPGRIGQAAMELNNPAAKALAGPIEELGNQADLWREQ